MSATKYYRLAMRVPATFLLLIGAAHFLLPTHGYNTEITSVWSEQTKDHFLYLATYMIGAFLLTLSILSFIYANLKPSRPIAWFATISTILWIARLLLELVYPVKVQLFFLPEPHLILTIVLGIIAAFYALASGIAWGILLIRK